MILPLLLLALCFIALLVMAFWPFIRAPDDYSS